MAPRRAVFRSNTPHRNQGEQFKDEVYRQMFWLEESRPGAEMGLALALLRAWMATASEPGLRSSRAWLKKISPVCHQMIKTSLRMGSVVRSCEPEIPQGSEKAEKHHPANVTAVQRLKMDWHQNAQRFLGDPFETRLFHVPSDLYFFARGSHMGKTAGNETCLRVQRKIQILLLFHP